MGFIQQALDNPVEVIQVNKLDSPVVSRRNIVPFLFCRSPPLFGAIFTLHSMLTSCFELPSSKTNILCTT